MCATWHVTQFSMWLQAECHHNVLEDVNVNGKCICEVHYSWKYIVHITSSALHMRQKLCLWILQTILAVSNFWGMHFSCLKIFTVVEV